MTLVNRKKVWCAVLSNNVVVLEKEGVFGGNPNDVVSVEQQYFLSFFIASVLQLCIHIL